MAIIPALDLRTPSNDVEIPHAPANVEAEQALLGAILYDNAAFERLGDNLQGRHFFEPFHQRLFEAIETNIRKGQLAEPILLAEQFARDPGFEALGGVRYLADLVDRAPPAANAPDYARAVYDLALRRDLIRIGGEIAAQASQGDAELSAKDQIEQAEAQLFQLAESGGVSQGFVPFSQALHGAVTMAAEAHSRDGGLAGLSTGLVDLDSKIGGLHPSDLIILAARPSMGKSSLAVNIGFDVARNYAWEPQPDGSKKTVRGGVVAFFSLEMSADQLAMRILAEVSGVSGDRLRKGEIDASEFGRVRDAALEIQEAPFYIDDTGGITMAKLAARARRLKRTVGLDLLIIDYLQLVTMGGSSRSDNRVQEVSAITQGMKALAKELAIPVIALAQLSRQVENREDKKPQLADLRESGSIEQDADMVMFIYRDEYYLAQREPKITNFERDDKFQEAHEKWQADMQTVYQKAELIIAKQRHGPTG
ncbi:MAG: replicative DNA helicase, partial [Alphaproteobacteria bacterium]|nr:replicative DNA helicase [Alphaproteobacteria bacterium]